VSALGARRCGPAFAPAHHLQHPYRPFAAAEAAADHHRVASTATRLLRGYYEATTRATDTRLLRGYYEAASYQATTRLLPGYYQATVRLILPGYYQEPRARHSAKQHRSSSPARLPAPLNPAARSRRRRSAHREKDLEEAVLHVPNKPANSGVHARHTSLSSRVSLESTPGAPLPLTWRQAGSRCRSRSP